MISTEQRLKMLTVPNGMVDIVLDTDAYNEIDDQFAISYALKAKEKLCVKALYAAPFLNERSTSPKDGMEKSYHEIINLLDLSNERIPFFKGSERYLTDEKTYVDSPSARDLVARANQYSTENPLFVVAIGAITNVASAILMDPTICDKMTVVWLGGHALHWHDSKEFNLMQDIAAVRVVFASGVPLVILPCMGVVSSFTTTGPELEYWLKGKNPLADYLASETIKAGSTNAKEKTWSRVIWDVTAIGWLLNKDNCFMEDELINTPIPQYDHHYSMDQRRPLCKYVYHIQRDRLMEDLFSKILLG